MIKEGLDNSNGADSEILGTRAIAMFLGVLMRGLEPPTYALRVRCSTT